MKKLNRGDTDEEVQNQKRQSNILHGIHADRYHNYGCLYLGGIRNVSLIRKEKEGDKVKVKVTASTFGNNIVEVFDTWNEAKRWMELTDRSNVPHQYNGEVYTIRFEVETLPDVEMTEDEFNELEELVEELPVEDVKEDE